MKNIMCGISNNKKYNYEKHGERKNNGSARQEHYKKTKKGIAANNNSTKEQCSIDYQDYS